MSIFPGLVNPNKTRFGRLEKRDTALRTHNPFWQSARILLKYKAKLALALAAAIVTAACFGGGLGMILPTLQLLLGERQPLNTLIQDNLGTPDQPQAVQEMAAWLSAHVPTEPFQAFVLVMAMIAVFTVLGSIGRYNA